MSATQKKKLCWNCEGRVPLEEENCPYCAVYLGPAPGNESRQDVLAPPYRLVESDDEPSQEAPDSPYQMQEDPNSEHEEAPDLETAKSDLKEVVIPLGLLSGGALFFLFGLMLLIFSSHGILTLSWSANYWYVYVIVALPAILIGWKTLGNFDQESETHL
jgi:hypothetical protein